MSNNVIHLGKHILWNCRRDNPECPGCMICDGGLSLCKVCKGGEIDLPTDCPGRPMHPDEMAAIANGHLDYTRDRGWHEVSAVKGTKK